jgi:hypothetical protein
MKKKRKYTIVLEKIRGILKEEINCITLGDNNGEMLQNTNGGCGETRRR